MSRGGTLLSFLLLFACGSSYTCDESELRIDVVPETLVFSFWDNRYTDEPEPTVASWFTITALDATDVFTVRCPLQDPIDPVFQRNEEGKKDVVQPMTACLNTPFAVGLTPFPATVETDVPLVSGSTYVASFGVHKTIYSERYGVQQSGEKYLCEDVAQIEFEVP